MRNEGTNVCKKVRGCRGKIGRGARREKMLNYHLFADIAKGGNITGNGKLSAKVSTQASEAAATANATARSRSATHGTGT